LVRLGWNRVDLLETDCLETLEGETARAGLVHYEVAREGVSLVFLPNVYELGGGHARKSERILRGVWQLGGIGGHVAPLEVHYPAEVGVGERRRGGLHALIIRPPGDGYREVTGIRVFAL